MINVSAPAAPPGYRATITGAGFLSGEAIAIYLDSPDRSLATTFADSSGAFRRDVTIPNGTPAGTHSICVQQQPLPRCVSFTVQAIAPPSTPTPSPTPTPTPTPTSSPAVLAPAPTSAGTTAWPGRLLANVGAPAASGGAILLMLALALAGWLLRRRGLTWAVREASRPRASVSPEAPPRRLEGGHPPIASRIFVCYRREDSGGHTGRLYDQLAPHFARGQVFMDIETIEPGLDFTQVVDMAVDTSAVVVAVIGRSWLSVTDEHDHRRLDNPDDYVRHELSAALARDKRVIPVLVQGAGMPGTSELPGPLKPLASRNAIELSDTRWKFDVGVLIRALESAIAQVRREAEMSRTEGRLLQ